MSIPDEPTVREYYELKKQLATLTEDMQTVISHPQYCIRFLQPGRLLQIKQNGHDFGWGVLVNWKKRKQKNNNTEYSDHESYIIDVLLKIAEGSASVGTRTHGDLPQGVVPPKEGEKCRFEVVPVLLNCIQAISHIRLHLPKEVTTPDSRNSVKRALEEVQRRFPDGIALLDPIENMNIRDESFKKLMRVS